MDETILRNLDTQHRRLRDLEAEVDRLLTGDVDPAPAAGRPPAVGDYAELTAVNDALRAERGWDEVDPAAALTPAQRAAFDHWRDGQRLPWGVDDVVAVGLAGAVGFAATWFDAELDRALRERLAAVKDSDLVTSWERDTRGLPIDHMGPGFGGPGHRVRSSGHDLGRAVAALRQIRDGVFRGYRWVDHVRVPVEAARFVPARSWQEALVLWAKHLAADVVTPMSLPLPGWTWMYEAPYAGLAAFAEQVYRGGAPGEGLNLRSGLATPTLAVVATETIVRTHVHARALKGSGSPALSAAEAALRSELLLAAHGLVGAASLGKTVARSFCAPTGPMALRHVNAPVLMRVGMLALEVRADVRGRAAAAAPEWTELLASTRL